MSLLVDWNPPHGTTVKVNCDAIVFNDHLMTGFGCVIRDSCRVELFAIWRDLTLAWEYGLRDVSCETDSLDAFLATQPSSHSEHVEDADLIMKIHEVLKWNWNAEVVLI
ncbi:hypothetical protein PIB30_069471 [Stylosanthes scabra]|uniref:RNase H type-1 domain-containing protein n=1 Tax=Stylosanthes scabra TaxID=79078 RepID=A0ABU6VLK8_9FABA|nr:hypothetical protein [Stylosanthes scabra]